MHKRLVILLAVLMCGCGQTNHLEGKSISGQEGSIAWEHDIAQAKARAENEQKPLLINFYADWCGWCRRMDKNTYDNRSVADAADAFVCVKVNTDEHRQLAHEYDVPGSPSTVFLRPDGSLIETVPGYSPPERFIDLLQQMKEAAVSEK